MVMRRFEPGNLGQVAAGKSTNYEIRRLLGDEDHVNVGHKRSAGKRVVVDRRPNVSAKVVQLGFAVVWLPGANCQKPI